MLLGYNTNSIAHHDPKEAIELLAEIGYRSLAITVDHQWMSPRKQASATQVQEIKHLLNLHNMRNVIETGARFLLNPRSKHQPTMLSNTAEEREQRFDFLKYSVDLAAELGSDCVSLWSGVRPPGVSDQEALERLAKELERVVKYAEQQQVIIGFEPEPGMYINNTVAFERLLQCVDSPALMMTMDIGHLCCQGEFPIADFIEKWQDRIVNVHIEDMRIGVHDHLMFGDGEIYFPTVMKALSEIDREFSVHVELSRHSHDAANIAQRSFDFLNLMIERGSSGE